jgi:Protein of unknown function DUF45
MPRSHDLDALLLIALGWFAPLPHRIHIDWVDLNEVDPSVFHEHNDWACCTGGRDGAFIGIHPDLKRAPRYVLLYLIGHELLHLAIPPHFGVAHHPAFQVADRLLPKHREAWQWLRKLQQKQHDKR